ncbi:MAG: hypothetical protein QM492_01940 [Rhodobacterales bacterium]
MTVRYRTNKNNEQTALIMAIVLSTIWLAGLATIFYFYPESARQISYDQSLSALIAVGLFLPLILIWIAALLARSLTSMRAEMANLRKSIARMDETLHIEIGEHAETRDRWIQSQLAQIVEHAKTTNSHVSVLVDETLAEQGRTPPPRETTALSQKTAPPVDEAQAALPLPDDGKAPGTPITIRELIKALNFPDDEKDTDGFRVLQRALKDHTTSKLVHSAQAVLTMLSEDGIYMDDLRLEKPDTSAWRQFAKGARGKDVAALGMIRDRTALTLTKTRLQNDTAFRETVHGFLKQFDTILAEFEKTAKDSELEEMGETRSASAFMLLGRVSGAFDAR